MDLSHAGSPEAYDILAQFYRQLLKPRDHFSKQVVLLKLIIETAALPSIPRILDAACGTGDVASLLYEEGFHDLEAIDGSRAMIDQRNVKNPVPMRHVSWTDLQRYFLEHGTYDLIFILGNSLAHAPVNQILFMLASLHEGLNAGGILLLDLRAWKKNLEGVLVEPSRPPDVYRYLGRIEAFEQDCLLYDRVEYGNFTQRVTYRLQPIGAVGEDKQDSGMIEAHLTYHTFDHQLVTDMLLSVGFQHNCVETRSVPAWPYLVVVARKKSATLTKPPS